MLEDLAWMAWTPATGAFFVALGLLLARHDRLAVTRPEVERVGMLGIPTRAATGCSSRPARARRRHPPRLDRLFRRRADRDVAGRRRTRLSSLWHATAISLVAAVVVFRDGPIGEFKQSRGNRRIRGLSLQWRKP